MSEWRKVRLGDICSFRGGTAFPQREQGNQTGVLPFIKVSDLARSDNRRHIQSSANWLLVEQRVRLRPSVAPTGAVVFAKIGEGLRSERIRSLLRETAIDNNLLAAIPRHDVVDPAFFYYLMQTLGLSSFAVGSALPYLKQSDLSAASCKIPSLNHQVRIGEMLGALDDKIEANRKLAATADALAVTLLTPFRPTVPLGTIAKQAKNSVNPAELADREVAHYSLPAFDLGSTPEAVQASAIKSNKYSIQEPAVLVSKLNPRFPRVWNVPEVGSVPALASTEFVVLQPTICSTNVLWAMAQHPRFARALQSLVAGTSGSHQRVRPAEMLSTLVPDPSAVPQATKARIDAVVQRSLAAGAESRTLQVLRDAVLPKLMSGALKVREAQRLVAQAV